MARLGFLLICIFSVAIVCGCGDTKSGPQTVGVSGTVLIDGQPAEGVEVTFVAEDFSSNGKTDADGRYELIQGAVPGENTVRLSKWEGGQGMKLDPESGIDEGQFEDALLATEGDRNAPAAVAGPRQLIPEDFQQVSYTVPEGGTDSADFRLRSQ